jgi:uncharacterized protein (DUF433 family)
MRIVYRGIQQTKDTFSGAARIKDRRVTVRNILMQLQNGQSIQAIAEGYALTEDEVKTAIGYALKCVGHFDDKKGQP